MLCFHPSRPLYMAHESVEIVSPDGTVLAGTLSLPRWARGPVPAVVMVHGSGRLGREHLIGDVRQLVREGLGVLAYDKRGVGASQGDYPQGGGAGFESVLHVLAQDAAAAFEKLRHSTGVDPARLGFFGASQAGWIIPLAAEQLEPKPRFHIILSGAAVSTGIEGYYSQLTGDGHRAPEVSDPAEVRALVEAFDGPAGYDPRPTWEALRVPTLWLLGARDESVPTFASVRVLDALRAAGGAHDVIVYPAADHGLHDTETGEPAPVWDDVRAWLRRQGVLDEAGE